METKMKAVAQKEMDDIFLMVCICLMLFGVFVI